MEKWVPAVIILVLLGGAGGGYFFASNQSASRISLLETQLASAQQQLTETAQDYNTLSGEYETLKTAKSKLDADFVSVSATYQTLITEHQALEANYASLSEEYSTLNSKYTTLSSVDSDYAQLVEDYETLKDRYDALSQTQGSNVYKTIGNTQMLEYYYQLTLDVRELNETLQELSDEPTSYRNTLTTSDILSVESAVFDAVGSSTDFWTNYQKIHEYVTSHIKYVNDTESVYIGGYSWIDVNGVRYLTGFDTASTRNYEQEPSFTLQYQQGDCDDQAHLEYAMLRYSNKYIIGTDYRLFIGWVFFSDGTSHIAVFQPVSTGELTILDPAGNYLTSTSSSTITSNDASAELAAYNEYWSSTGSITRIILYQINLDDGSYTVATDGTLTEVAAFLES